MITSLILLPLIIGILLLGLKDSHKTFCYALATSILTFFLSLVVGYYVLNFGPLEESYPWLTIIGSTFRFQVDEINFPFVILTTFLFPVSLVFAKKEIEERVNLFFSLFLILEAGILGVFTSFDLILFFIFWEFSLIPMYFVIIFWGHELKSYAGFKFLLMTMVGSVFLIYGIIWIGTNFGTFDLVKLIQELVENPLPENSKKLLFWLFAIAFLIKVPAVPLHTWLPDAHTQAPTPGSVILAGVLLKMGIYGLMRFNLYLFPDVSVLFQNTMILIGTLGIIYGGLMSLMEEDLKRLIAYSSVSHMGYMLAGLFTFNKLGISGSMMQVLNHGITTGTLFIFTGVLYKRFKSRKFIDLQGLGKRMPIFSLLFGISFLSTMGIPGLNNFPGEFLALLGIASYKWIFGIFSIIGIIIGTLYSTKAIKLVIFSVKNNHENASDLDKVEFIAIALMTLLMVLIGVYPQSLLKMIAPCVKSLIGVFGDG